MKNQEYIFCSWSGGKDCCLALDSYLRTNPNSKVHLLTMIKKSLGKTYGHFITEGLLQKQADAMGLEISFGYSDDSNYEDNWCIELERLKKKGVTKGIFGDIDLQVHHEWIERVMKKLKLQFEMPLWSKKRKDVVEDFINKGYKATIICIREEKCQEKYLGKTLDLNCVEEMEKDAIDPSAEGGEFHTFTVTGPLFKRNLALFSDGISEGNNHVYLNNLELVSK